MKNLRIRINSNCKNEYENIEEFLLSFGSTQIERIWLYGHLNKFKNENLNSEDEYSFYYDVFPCSSYFYGLRHVLSKATKYIYIYSISFSSKEFSAIFRAAKHVKQLHFDDCKILTDGECELEQMEGWQIKFLIVDDCYHVCKHIRGYEDSCMKIFLSIVGCQNLLRSLRQIKFKCEKEMKKKLLSKAKEILGNDYNVLMPSIKCF